MPRSSVSCASSAPTQAAQRRRRAAHRHARCPPAAARGPRRSPPRAGGPSRARRRTADRSAGRRRRGTRSRSERTRTTPSRPSGLADRDLARAAAHVDHGHVPSAGAAACAWRPRRTAAPPPRRRARQRHAAGLLHGARPARRGWGRCGSRRWPPRRSARRPPRAPPRLGAHHLGGLGDLLRRDRAAAGEALADAREGALGHELAQRAVAGVGHEQPGGVAADVDAGADQAVGGASSGMRGVLELAEQAGDDEGGLLADVHGIVADPLDAARHQHHVHRPLALIGVVADLEREVEAPRG